MKQYKLLTLDIWDTVLRRRCHPDEIKLATARQVYLTCFSRLREEYRDTAALLRARCEAEHEIALAHPAELDDEYVIGDVFARMLERVLTDGAGIPALAEQLVEYELQREMDTVYLDPGIVEALAGYEYERLGYVSDFYAGTAFLDALLEKAGFPYAFDVKYVSCDHGLNKRSGRLFEKLLASEGIDPADILHMGDNAHSDVTVPERLGMAAVRYLPAAEHAARRQREALFSVGEGYRLNAVPGLLPSDRTTAGQLGPFFANFVLWIAENCVQRGIRKVFFFTREGEFYIQLFHRLRDSGVFALGQLPEAQVLEVSRLSTFAASLREPTLEELMRMWNQYSVQSMAAFGKSLGLEPGGFHPWLERHSIPAEEIITYPWLDERVQRLFADGEFVCWLQQRIEEKRALFRDYAAGRGLDLNTPEEVAVVDIGWRGTIQDNICHMFPRHRFVGFYLALDGFLNEQPANAEKLGYLNDQREFWYILRVVAPVEMLCNSPFGSTVGYERTGEGVRAVRKRETGEEAVFESYTAALQQQMLRRAESFYAAAALHPVTAAQLKAPTYEGFYAVLLTPRHNRDLIDAFFSLLHNEEFGVGRYMDKHTRLRLDLMVGALFSARRRQELKVFLGDTTWPQGYLTKYRLTPLVKVYNYLLGLR